MKRIAVILPAAYRGGTLQWVRSFATMLRRGSLAAGDEWELVVCVLKGVYDVPAEFRELRAEGIKVREIGWKTLSEAESRNALRWSDVDPEEEDFSEPYGLPVDGVNDLLDCDFWIFISDRVHRRILPIRPYAVFVADVLQRYAPEGFSDGFFAYERSTLIPFVRRAEFVLTTTPAASGDVHGYLGVPRDRIVQLPFFIDLKSSRGRCPSTPRDPYFVWLTNSSPHKNHLRVLDALRRYYGEMGGRLKAFLIGPLTRAFHPDSTDEALKALPYVAQVRAELARSPHFEENIVVGGELPDAEYADALRRGRFLLNANLYDNGSFSTCDSVQFGRPCLCADYPAQRFIDRRLGLNARWFDPYDPQSLAEGLLHMETHADDVPLPSPEELAAFGPDRLAVAVHAAVAERLEGVDAHAYR